MSLSVAGSVVTFSAAPLTIAAVYRIVRLSAVTTSSGVKSPPKFVSSASAAFRCCASSRDSESDAETAVGGNGNPESFGEPDGMLLMECV
jgi:hypothetical protein